MKQDMDFVVTNNRSKLRFIPYIGNKSGFSHIFDSMIPDNFSDMKFYDVFGGGGSFTFYICSRFGAKNVFYNDNNPVIVNLLKYLKKDPRGLLKKYEKHRKNSSPEYYYEIRDKEQSDDLVSAGRFMYLAKNAFSGKIRFNPKGKFNCPMRINSKCPMIDKEQFLHLSSLIQDLKIYNESFEYFESVKKSFLYLDPPYLNNPNGHYNNLIEPNRFIEFVKNIEKDNKVMISEQNSSKDLHLSQIFNVYSIHLKRSLQYFTKNSSHEIIAINYLLNKMKKIECMTN